jgi:tetratricopeptide (TPR) repeat protein
LAGCAPAADRLAVVQGNYLARGGSAQAAVGAYLRAGRDPAVAPYAAYDLGLVYLQVGELPGAAGQFRTAAESPQAAADAELRYRAWYGFGLAAFRAGDFAQAAAAFRSALEADGRRLAAKRNLELSLRNLDKKTSAAAAAAPVATGDALAAEPKVLFDFLREKESDRWKSREWQDTAAAGPDY